jgi:hypothetical protein
MRLAVIAGEVAGKRIEAAVALAAVGYTTLVSRLEDHRRQQRGHRVLEAAVRDIGRSGKGCADCGADAKPDQACAQ